MYELRIVIIDPSITSRRLLKEHLSAAGYLVVADCASTHRGMQIFFQIQPDVLLISNEYDFEVIRLFEEHRIAPLILIINENDSNKWLPYLKNSWIFGVIHLGLNSCILDAKLQMAVENFSKLISLEGEIRLLKQSIEERKFLEKAKGLLMDKKGWNEEKAFQYLRRISMDCCLPMEKVSKAVIHKLEKSK